MEILRNDAKDTANIIASYGYTNVANEFHKMIKFYNKLIFNISTASNTTVLDDIDKKIEKEYKKFREKYNEVLYEIWNHVTP